MFPKNAVRILLPMVVFFMGCSRVDAGTTVPDRVVAGYALEAIDSEMRALRLSFLGSGMSRQEISLVWCRALERWKRVFAVLEGCEGIRSMVNELKRWSRVPLSNGITVFTPVCMRKKYVNE